MRIRFHVLQAWACRQRNGWAGLLAYFNGSSQATFLLPHECHLVSLAFSPNRRFFSNLPVDLLVRMFIAWPMKDEDMTAFILLINDESEIFVIKEAITATSSSR